MLVGSGTHKMMALTGIVSLEQCLRLVAPTIDAKAVLACASKGKAHHWLWANFHATCKQILAQSMLINNQILDAKAYGSRLPSGT